ncbi:MAG: sensor histidine kinase [Caulobacteraceae bacterium]
MLGGSTSFRLAALYTAGFSLAVAVLGLLTILATRAALTDQFDARLKADQATVAEGYEERGLPGLLREMGEASRGPNALLFGVQTEAGAPVEGPLAPVRAPPGLSRIRFVLNGKSETLRVLSGDIGGRYRLIVGDKADRIDGLSRKVLWGFGLAFAALLALGIAAGFALSRAVKRRLDAISGAAEAIIDGDLGRRIPVQRGDDDLSRLAATVNRMLDRIGVLMDSLRQMTGDVAHDLRTPLNRLRQRLERSAHQAEDPAHRAEIEAALRDVDAILATFAAVLRISEVEAGARRAAFKPVDLQALARAVAEDFSPAAEDAGHSLEFREGPPAWIEGDAELLTQMTVNLVENALRHTPQGCTVRLSTAVEPDAAVLVVVDDGPGVPEAEHARLFDRFYRLERSRSTPGSGLGLAMVQAIARLHRGEARLSDGAPGLKARVIFPTS